MLFHFHRVLMAIKKISNIWPLCIKSTSLRCYLFIHNRSLFKIFMLTSCFGGMTWNPIKLIRHLKQNANLSLHGVFQRHDHHIKSLVFLPLDHDWFKVPSIWMTKRCVPTWCAPLEYWLLVMSWTTNCHTLKAFGHLRICYLGQKQWTLNMATVRGFIWFTHHASNTPIIIIGWVICIIKQP